MTAVLVRNVIPVVTAVAATFYLAIAPGDFVSEADAATVPAQVQRCLAGGREAEACVDEADGIALVERADWAARTQADLRRASR